MKKKENKEKMISVKDVEERFKAFKIQSMKTNYHAAKSMEDILSEFKEFVDNVLITQPTEQTLLKKMAEEKLEYIESRLAVTEMAATVTKDYLDSVGVDCEDCEEDCENED